MAGLARFVAIIVVISIVAMSFGILVGMRTQITRTIATVQTTNSTITPTLTVTVTSKIPIYPIPDNVTFLLVQSSSCDTSSTYQIYINKQLSQQGATVKTDTSVIIYGLYAGDNLSIQWSSSTTFACLPSSFGYLYDNNTLVAQDSATNSGGMILWVA